MTDLMQWEYPFHVYWAEDCNCYMAKPFGLKVKNLFAETYGNDLADVYSMAGDLALAILDDCSVEELLLWSTTLDTMTQTDGLHIVMVKPRWYCSYHKCYDAECHNEHRPWCGLSDAIDIVTGKHSPLKVVQMREKNHFHCS